MAFLSGQSCTQILVHRWGNKTRISAPFRRRTLPGLFEEWLVLARVSWKIFSIIFWASNHQIVDKEDFTEFASLRSKRFRLVSEQRNTEEGDFRFWPREKWNESQKVKEGGGGGEGRKRLQTNPSILKTCVRQRTQRLIGSASRTILTCVDQRFVSYWEVMYGTWHAY